MHKFKDFDLHQRRFLSLAVVIFAAVAVFHFARVVFGWDLVAGGIQIPPSVSILAGFIAVMMVVMGVYYRSAK